MIEVFLNLFKTHRNLKAENSMIEKRLNRKIVECNIKDKKIKELKAKIEESEEKHGRNRRS